MYFDANRISATLLQGSTAKGKMCGKCFDPCTRIWGQRQKKDLTLRCECRWTYVTSDGRLNLPTILVRVLVCQLPSSGRASSLLSNNFTLH